MQTHMLWSQLSNLANQQCLLAGEFSHTVDGNQVCLQHTAHQQFAVFHHYSAEPVGQAQRMRGSVS